MTPLTVLDGPRLELHRTVVGPIDNNVFILRCKATHRSVLIDAASEPEILLPLAASMNVEQVVTTHGHWDHIGAVPDMRDAGYRVGISAADAHRLAAYDFVIEDAAIIGVGALSLRALSTPGHTAGSTCFKVEGEPLLFTGDTLFPGGPGATRSPDSSFDEIIESVSRLFEEFDDDTIVLPGHGTSTTIGDERPHLEEWRARGW